MRRARWNESAVTRNKRGGDPKLLVEVHEARGREKERERGAVEEGLGMSLRRGGDETLP